MKWRCGWTVRTPSRCVGGRRLDTVKEEATAAGGRRGTCVEMPAACAAARTLAITQAAIAGSWSARWRERRLHANVPRRRPVAVTSSFTSHAAPSPSACQASTRLLNWLCWSVRTPSRCVGGRHLDTVKEEANAAGGRRGPGVQLPATRAAARKLATTVTEATEATNKKPGFRRAFRFTGHGPAQAPYFFFGMYRSVIVPS